MKRINLYYSKALLNIDEKTFEQETLSNKDLFYDILDSYKNDTEQVLGWMDIDRLVDKDLVSIIEDKAQEIKEKADIFLLIGVGGSNQGARAVIKALQKEGKPKIIYCGNNLSPIYINNVLEQIKGKSVYANIIAKNFATLEPGICFRVLRNYMEKVYGEQEAAKRIIATGSPGGSSLEHLAKDKGYLFLPFPIDVGGRFSVMSAVGLLPIAVGGISVKEIISGAKAMREYAYNIAVHDNDIFKYAVLRNMLQKKGKTIEIMAYEDIIQCMERGVKEVVGTMIVNFGSVGYENKIEMISLDEMAESYKKEGI